MNRLADLLIQLNRERLPDDYIQKEIEAFIEDLKLELGSNLPDIEETEESPTPPVFCLCTTQDAMQRCLHKNTCIRVGTAY